MRKALVGSLGVLLAALPSTSVSAWEQGEQSVTRFFVPFSKRLMIIGAVMFFAVAPMIAQNRDLQQKLAAVKQSVAENQQRLHQYQWVETTQLTLKGDAKPPKQFMCQYGPDGTVQKTPMGPPQTTEGPPKSATEARKPVVVAAGTTITVRLSTGLGSQTSKTGDTFIASVAYPVTMGDKVVIPKSADAVGTVLEAKAKGKIKGEARLKLALRKITIKGRSYLIETEEVATTEKGKGSRTAATTGGGAAGGALIGGIAGGGKGAGIGALVGAGVGLVGGAFTGNDQIELPAETILTFALTQPLTLKYRSEDHGGSEFDKMSRKGSKNGLTRTTMAVAKSSQPPKFQPQF